LLEIIRWTTVCQTKAPRYLIRTQQCLKWVEMLQAF
jgi:hypothetical protein